MRKTVLVVVAILLSFLPARIRADEEELYYKLERVWDDLRQNRRMLSEQITKLSDPENKLVLVAIRLEQIQDSLTKSKKPVDQVHKDWKKILDDLIVRWPAIGAAPPKRGRARIIEEYSERISKPLARISDSKTGQLLQVEKAIQNLVQILNQDQKPKPAVLKSVEEKYDRLLDSIHKVLDASEPAPICSMLTELLIGIERQQREITRELDRQMIRPGPLRGLIEESK
jgi:hypothetical protein